MQCTMRVSISAHCDRLNSENLGRMASLLMQVDNKRTPKLWGCGYCAQQQLHGHYAAAHGATRYLLAAEILSRPCRKLRNVVMYSVVIFGQC